MSTAADENINVVICGVQHRHVYIESGELTANTDKSMRPEVLA